MDRGPGWVDWSMFLLPGGRFTPGRASLFELHTLGGYHVLVRL